MPNVRDIVRALCVVAMRLLMMLVFLGPAGLGSSSALAAESIRCSFSCTCEETAPDEHDCDDHEGSAESEACADDCELPGADHHEPCEDECPDDCPSCGCCIGAAMAVIPVAPPSSALSSTSARMLALVAAAPVGAATGVFRPPRSLT